MTHYSSAITQDRFLNGRMVLKQPAKGHRIGLDAMLLAEFAPAGAKYVADFGAGVGAVGIAYALNNPDANMILVERDEEIASLARENLDLNGLNERVSVCEADLFAPARTREMAGLIPRSVDLVLTNPPFLNENEARISPNDKRRAAHVLEGGTLDDWIRAAAHMLKPSGVLVMIHRADALHDILNALQGTGETKSRFGGVEITLVYTDTTKPASRVLVKATLGSRKKLGIMPAIITSTD
jgi:tRNA1(Val) A37 N6-methylase TrmN6